jgi:hypothetical protein
VDQQGLFFGGGAAMARKTDWMRNCSSMDANPGWNLERDRERLREALVKRMPRTVRSAGRCPCLCSRVALKEIPEKKPPRH